MKTPIFTISRILFCIGDGSSAEEERKEEDGLLKEFRDRVDRCLELRVVHDQVKASRALNAGSTIASFGGSQKLQENHIEHKIKLFFLFLVKIFQIITTFLSF